MLKILHVIGRMDRAGAESMIMNYYRAIDKTRFQFDFLVQTEDEADYDQEILSYGASIYRLPRYLIYNTLAYRRACRKFFSEHHDYDIVHGHLGSCASIYLREAQKYHIFTIAHSHSTGMVSKPLEGMLFKIVTHSTRYVADYFFACSTQAGLDRYGKAVVESPRFQVIYNAIDGGKYRYTPERHQKLKKDWNLEDKFVIGHVGRFQKEKNHEFLVETFLEVLHIIPNSHLVLTGDGDFRKKVEGQVQKLGIESHVTFTGVRNDIPDIMNLFDAFVFPSFYEGLGIVLIEAQAAGLPCIVSNAIVDEAILTKHVKRLDLGLGPKQWAKEIRDFAFGYQRTDEYDRIVDAGYDIDTNTRNLEQFYLTHRKS